MFLANYFNQRGQYFKCNKKSETIASLVDDNDEDNNSIFKLSSTSSESVVVHNGNNNNYGNALHESSLSSSVLFDESHLSSSVSVASSSQASSSSSSSSHTTIGSYRSISSSNYTNKNRQQIHKKNRKIINRYLKRISRQADLDGADLVIDETHGCCYIPFRKFLIMIRHTPDEEIQFDTMVFDLHGDHCNTESSIKSIQQTRKKVTAMEVRKVCVGKHKATIRIVNDDEVHLYKSRPIQGLKFHHMVDLLDDFMATAININSDLTVLCR
jgi:hypothetical protein